MLRINANARPAKTGLAFAFIEGLLPHVERDGHGLHRYIILGTVNHLLKNIRDAFCNPQRNSRLGIRQHNNRRRFNRCRIVILRQCDGASG